MTTARERYEQKTKVVTFRVHQEVYEQIEEVKARTGLSNTDLIKLGAGIAQEEIKAKLADISGLKARLAELKSSVEQEQQRLSKSLDEERRRRLEELDTEMKVFKLFDRGWRVETVSYKMGISQATVRHYFREWAKERKDKKAAEVELLSRCLKKHIDRLEQQRMWAAFRYGRSATEDVERLQKQIDDCWRLLSTPEQMGKEDREFLIAEYSSNLQ
jgi:predicted transcriptional regulator